MKKHLTIMILVTMIPLAAVDSGFALTLYFEDNVASNTLIANRESLEGYFDIRPKIEGFTTGTNDRYFNRGMLHFSFTDDNDLSEGGYYYSRWERKLKDNVYHFKRRRYDVLRDPFEMVAIDALGTTRYKHTPFYISKQTSGRPDETVTDDRWGPFDYTYRTEFYTAIVGWGGDVYHSMVLDEYWLERISTIGLLHYDLKAIMGDIVLRSARLELESNPQASPVPEPSTFLLVLLSAGLLGGGSTLKKLYRRYGLP